MTTSPGSVDFSHLFFDLYGVLINPALLPACYEAAVGRVMSARYGGSPGVWSAAYERIVADWDSYYADLDLTGEDGMAHLWEGLYRTTRALFRLADVPEPDKAELTVLSRELPGLLPLGCDLTYADVRPSIQKLHAAGLTLGVASHALSTQARAMLAGGGLAGYFVGPVMGPDVSGRFEKDARFYAFVARHAGAAPGQCLVVSNSPHDLKAAAAAGWHTLLLSRAAGADLFLAVSSLLLG